MNLLLDQNIYFRVKKKLIKDFPKCRHVSDCGLSDTEDPDIWEYAKINDFTIVTYDQDYFEISLFMPKYCLQRQLAL
jgi:predicted nuclease of predicted toxin-antitoxin system